MHLLWPNLTLIYIQILNVSFLVIFIFICQQPTNRTPQLEKADRIKKRRRCAVNEDFDSSLITSTPVAQKADNHRYQIMLKHKT